MGEGEAARAMLGLEKGLLEYLDGVFEEKPTVNGI